MLAAADWNGSAVVQRPNQARMPEISIRTISLRPGQRTTVALVGPAGSGKTTAVAKLASAALFSGQFRVGMISLDHCKIGAPEQFCAIAKSIGCPHAVARTANECRAAMKRFGNCDLVLVDTVGLPAHDGMRLSAQADFLAEIGPDEVHLCIPLTADASTIGKDAFSYKKMRLSQAFLTRFDDLTEPSRSIHAAARCGLALSYISNSSELRSGLMTASREMLEERMSNEVAD